MKQLVLLTFFVFVYPNTYAQVGIGTNNPNPAAVLDINSDISTGTYGGLKLPTVTLAQRATIATPIPDGLMIYLYDGSNRCVQIYDSNTTSWVNFYCMNLPPEAQNVIITGTTNVGDVLTTTYDHTNTSFQTDNENDTPATPLYQWYSSTTAVGTGTPIVGATSSSYTIVAADAGNYISLGITPTAATGASPGLEILSVYQLIPLPTTEVYFDSTTSSGDEDDIATIQLSLSNPSSTVATTVEINLDASSTIGPLGTDYDIDYSSTTISSYPFTVTFPAGTSSQAFDVYLYNDVNIVDEILVLNLQNPSGGDMAGLIAPTTHTLTINDDDAPVLLGIQDFETSPATPTLSYFDYDNGSIQTGNGVSPNTATYIGARSYGVNNNYADIDFGPVNTTTYSSAILRFRLASFSLNSTGNGADGGDYVDVYISDDNGLNYSYELEITGNNNRQFDYSATGNYSLAYDGNNISVSVTTPNGSSGYTYVEITGLPSVTNLVTGIVLYNNNNDELWVIDNVEIYGIP